MFFSVHLKMQDKPCQDFKTNLTPHPPIPSCCTRKKNQRMGNFWDWSKLNTSVQLQIRFLTTFFCIITYNSHYTQNPKIKLGMKAKSFQDLKVQILLPRLALFFYQNYSYLYVFLKPHGARNNIHVDLCGYNNTDAQNNLFFLLSNFYNFTTNEKVAVSM